ncbi:MAG: recombinase family protein [Candidatus Verstraetearchaeota archaeon]|jgi:DNA invertase Pin-like site-specific DNA recombinase|nr:recombinase family protein [Candidatus Verstraetearchaeota archaeon]
MKCVAYVRVSTKEQDEEIQKKAIEEFIKTRNMEIIKWYIDKGESGAKLFKERPGASHLLKEINELKPDCIISWSLDRLGRTMLDTLNIIMEFESKGIKIITIKEEWLQTLDNNIRKLIISILSWIAEFERRRIRERQEEAWKQGKQKGRPQKVPDGLILQYIKKYQGLSKKAIWKLLKADGYDISYDRFIKRIKRISKKSK